MVHDAEIDKRNMALRIYNEAMDMGLQSLEPDEELAINKIKVAL